jgi:hypothetical protein
VATIITLTIGMLVSVIMRGFGSKTSSEIREYHRKRNMEDENRERRTRKELKQVYQMEKQ